MCRSDPPQGYDRNLASNASDIMIVYLSSSFVFLLAGDGISVWVLGVLVTIKALGNETGGSYSLFEEVIYPGQGLPRHVHTMEDETWYMLEGELMWDLGGREFHGKKGSFIHLPRFIPHSFKNKSKKPARMVLMFAPGGVEQWYLDVGEKASDLKAMPPRVTHEVFSQALCRGKEYGIMFIDHREDEEFSNGSKQAGYF